MGDPVGAAAHIRQTLAPDGTWMIVEPNAADNVEQNLNPVGRVFYGASTVVCTPASLSQEVGLALGAQAGEQRLTEVIKEGGFSRVQRDRNTIQHGSRGQAVAQSTERSASGTDHPGSGRRPQADRKNNRRRPLPDRRGDSS